LAATAVAGHPAILLPDRDLSSYFGTRELVPTDMLGDIERAKIVITSMPLRATQTLRHAGFPIPPTACPSAAFKRLRSGSKVSRQRSQITSISALLAIDFRVICGTRS
jgi:hypothetical protein